VSDLTTTHYVVPAHLHDKRIDAILASVQDTYSRTYFQTLIDQGHITVNGLQVKRSSERLRTDDTITVTFPAITLERPRVAVSDTIPLKIIFEHPDFFIIEKPPYIAVHAAAPTSTEPTVVDWLLTHYADLAAVGAAERPGIVHRLDKDTSGLLIVPRNNTAHELLSDMFKQRLIKKTYYAIVTGHPENEGTIDFPVGRDPHTRLKMCTYSAQGRPSTTHYSVVQHYTAHSLLKLNPITGRTHQLRVHCAALGYPIVGDKVYGTKSKLIPRQALHAAELSFTYKDEQYTFELPLPDDMQQLLNTLTPL